MAILGLDGINRSPRDLQRPPAAHGRLIGSGAEIVCMHFVLRCPYSPLYPLCSSLSLYYQDVSVLQKLKCTYRPGVASTRRKSSVRKHIKFLGLLRSFPAQRAVFCSRFILGHWFLVRRKAATPPWPGPGQQGRQARSAGGAGCVRRSCSARIGSRAPRLERVPPGWPTDRDRGPTTADPFRSGARRWPWTVSHTTVWRAERSRQIRPYAARGGAAADPAGRSDRAGSPTDRGLLPRRNWWLTYSGVIVPGADLGELAGRFLRASTPLLSSGSAVDEDDPDRGIMARPSW